MGTKSAPLEATPRFQVPIPPQDPFLSQRPRHLTPPPTGNQLPLFENVKKQSIIIPSKQSYSIVFPQANEMEMINQQQTPKDAQKISPAALGSENVEPEVDTNTDVQNDNETGNPGDGNEIIESNSV